MSHESSITFNCNYVYIENFNQHFNFCVSKSFYYGTNYVLLQKTLTGILNCCDIHFTYILFHMANLLNGFTLTIHIIFLLIAISQPAFTCSKSPMETPKCMKSVHN